LSINPISDQPPKIKVINFGAPRSGNAGFATLFNKMIPNHVRCIHKHDMVPKVPPQIMNFKHVANNVVLSEPPRDGGTGQGSLRVNLVH
jgi:predicted lipase